MSKKNRLFLIILPFILLFIAILINSILSMFVNEFSGIDSSFLTMYEKEYFTKISFWWIYLVFVPFCLFFCFLGIKHKDKIICCTSTIIILVMVLISFVNFKDTSNFSTSKEYLIQIEKNINFNFSEDTTVLIYKNASSLKKINILCEGVIRIPANKENIFNLKNNISWNNQMDNNIYNNFSEKFNFYVSSLDRVFYTIDDNNTLIFLAYYVEQNIVFFTFVKLVE